MIGDGLIGVAEPIPACPPRAHGHPAIRLVALMFAAAANASIQELNDRLNCIGTPVIESKIDFLDRFGLLCGHAAAFLIGES